MSETAFLISLNWLLYLLVSSVVFDLRVEALQALHFCNFYQKWWPGGGRAPPSIPVSGITPALSLLHVQENNQSIFLKTEKASVAHGTKFICSFPIRIKSRSRIFWHLTV